MLCKHSLRIHGFGIHPVIHFNAEGSSIYPTIWGAGICLTKRLPTVSLMRSLMPSPKLKSEVEKEWAGFRKVV